MRRDWLDWLGYAFINVFIFGLIYLVLIGIPGIGANAPHRQPCEICPIGTCSDRTLPHAPNPE